MNINLSEDQKKALGLVDEREDFYFKVENAVIDGDYLENIYEKMVFIVLCRYCNNGKIAFPSIPAIAKNCGCGITSVKNALKSLEEKGFIKKVSRKKEGTNENDTNLYAIQNLEKLIKVGRDTTDVGRVATDPGSCGVQYKEQVKKNNIKRIMNHDSDMTLFENLFKEFGINFTKTNQASVKRLLNSMKLEEVKSYLIETYRNLKENPKINSIGAVFSEKIATGERQAAYKAPEQTDVHDTELSQEEIRAINKANVKKNLKYTVNMLLDSVAANILTTDEAIAKFDYGFGKGTRDKYGDLVSEYRQKLIDNL